MSSWLNKIPGVRPAYRRACNVHYRYVRWLANRDRSETNIDKSHYGSGMLIVTIAFNEERFIRKQIQNIKRYVKDSDYLHVIVDNSSNHKKRELIKDICEKETVAYVAVPAYLHKLIFTGVFGTSCSHGAALNWMIKHVIGPLRPKRFTLLDHDMFPFRDVNLTEALGQDDFYGTLRMRDAGWYLWPGYSIYLTEPFLKSSPDFMPMHIDKVYFDTGGTNYIRFFSKYDLTKSRFTTDKLYRVQNTPGLSDYNSIFHVDCICRIDKVWVHIINGSNYTKTKEKDLMIDNFLPTIP